jgi:HAD superfamily hydrolase (TIGR01509 family)
MLEALVFDVDGTVAETEDMHRRAFNLSFARHGLDITWDAREYRRLLAVAGGRERITYAFAQSGRRVGRGEIAAIHESKTHFYGMLVEGERIAWRPGVRRLMEEAWSTGRAVGLATTTSSENLDPLFAPVLGAGWRSRFAAIVTGEMVVRKKPAPDAHLEALRRMGVAASRAVAFEDSATGVAAASAAGITVIATPSEWLPNDDLARADLVLQRGLGDVGHLWDEPHPWLRERWLSIQELAAWHREREAACSLRA